MMTPVQWFPGHMHKAQKEVREILPQVDIIIEVLDARIPFSSENPMISQLRGDKPTIKIFNKSDLADPNKTYIWQKYLEQEKSVKTLALNAQQTDIKQQVLDLIKEMAPNKGDSTRVIQVLILGIPNVGKSTLINSLAGRPITKTGNEPAVTKMQQRIKLEDNITLFDTPGMLWANIDNAHSGYRLAATGGIKETAFAVPDIASYLIEYLLENYPEGLKKRFNLSTLPRTDLEFLEEAGRQRGCLRSGGMVDLDKISRILITEYRNKEFGEITLESPNMMERELKLLEIIRAAKAEKKQTRLKARKNKKYNQNPAL